MIGCVVAARTRGRHLPGSEGVSKQKVSDRKRSEFLRLVAEGCSNAEALRRIDRAKPTFDYWRRSDPEFRAAYERLKGKVAEDYVRPAVPDFPEFCETYLGQKLFLHQLQWYDLLMGREPRGLHPSMSYELGRKDRLIINTPPGHGKSTSITVNFVVWQIVKNPDVKVKIVSKSQRMAEDFLLQIKMRLTDSMYHQLQVDFGPPGGWAADAAQWKANRFYVSAGVRSAEQKDPTVEALGIRGQIYGARCDIIILDDVVDSLNVGEFEKQIKWIQGMLMNRLGRNGTLLVVGTRIASQDLYSELLKPAYYGGRKPPWTHLAQRAVLEFAENPQEWVTLWPRTDSPEDSSMVPGEDGLYDKWDGPLLAERRDEVGPSEFSRMYQQETVHEDLPFKAEHILACQQMRAPGPLTPNMPNVRPQGMEGLHVIAGLDPASVGHTAAVVLGVDPESGIRYVLDVFNKAACPPEEIKTLLYTWTDRYRIQTWRIERNAFQTWLTRDSEIITGLANRGCVLTEHTTTGQSKHDPNYGVLAMARLFETQMIRIPETSNERVRTLFDQLCLWQPDPPRGLKTDLVMALWFAEIRAGQLAVRSGAKPVFRDSEFYTPADKSQRSVRDMSRYESQFSLPSSGFAETYR